MLKKYCFDHVRTYTSDYAGAGKSFRIRRSLCSWHKYAYIPTTSSVQFLSLVNEVSQSMQTIEEIDGEIESEAGESNVTSSQERKEEFLHIDIFDTVGFDLNSYLFELILFWGFYDMRSGCVTHFPPSLAKFSIEIASGPLCRRLPVPFLFPVEKVVSSADTFESSKRHLLRGMGPVRFFGRRYDGTSMRKIAEGIKPANAYERLQYVCTALDIIDSNGGRFPYVFESNVAESHGLLESLRMSMSLSMSLSLSVSDSDDMEGRTCFDLLAKYMKLSPDRVSLWCIWNFVNMVYWQLRDMHYPDSPLNTACMPDPSGEKKETTEAKELTKGVLVNFILQTAVEFATRQTVQADGNEIVGIRVDGFSRYEFNGFWRKRNFLNDNEMVFSKEAKDTTFYFYFRSKTSRYVIDDVIAPSGVVFSQSSTSSHDGVWKTGSGWVVDPKIVLTEVKGKRSDQGYLGESIKVAGFKDPDENGVYLRQPPYDDIEGKPHYLKMPVRRHLFWGSKDNAWRICPLCNEEEGAFAVSETKELLGRWKVMGEDKYERSITVVKVSLDEYNALRLGRGSYAVEEKPKKQGEEEVNEYLALEELFNRTLKWSDSNHECLLFSNHNHVVSFMSMDPKKMRREMHPNLLAFLEENHINVGESLDELTSRHHEVLTALTEVRDVVIGRMNLDFFELTFYVRFLTHVT